MIHNLFYKHLYSSVSPESIKELGTDFIDVLVEKVYYVLYITYG